MPSQNPVPKHKDLIYDVGMHKGEDTEFYLKKGFRVIGFEADPDLVRHCKAKFSSEIEQNQLTIVEGAIVDRPPSGVEQQKVKFYTNLGESVWGTTLEQWARRNELLGTHSKIIDVNVVDFSDCLERYGIPYYLKIDIEGADMLCVKALRDFSVKPDYISIESEKLDVGKLEEEIILLEELGYSEFKAIQQEDIPAQAVPNPPAEGIYVPHTFQRGSSGLFGKDLPGNWKSKRQILNTYRTIFALYRLFGDYSPLRRSSVGQLFIQYLQRRRIPGWYDTHARHSSVSPGLEAI